MVGYSHRLASVLRRLSSIVRRLSSVLKQFLLSVFLRKYQRDLDQIIHRGSPIGLVMHGTFWGGWGFKMAARWPSCIFSPPSTDGGLFKSPCVRGPSSVVCRPSSVLKQFLLSVFLRKYQRDLDQIIHRGSPIGLVVHGTFWGGWGFKMAARRPSWI